MPTMVLLKRFLIAFISVTTMTGSYAEQAEKRISIAVIPKGTTHNFWKSVEAGARQAAHDLDIDMTWKGPLREDDRQQQISIVEQFVSENKSGIVLAPLDSAALH